MQSPSANQPSTEQHTQPKAPPPESLAGWFIFFKVMKKSDIEDVYYFKFEEFILKFKAEYQNQTTEIKDVVDDIDVKISTLSFRIKRDIELQASPKFFEILDSMKRSLVLLETLINAKKNKKTLTESA